MGPLRNEGHRVFAVVQLHRGGTAMLTLRVTARLIVASFATLTATACASARLKEGRVSSPIRALGDSSMSPVVDAGRVRGDELGRAGVISLYEALQRVRPEFLRGPGSPNARGEVSLPSVRLNGLRIGGPDVLKLVQVDEVLDVRYRRPATALTMYGATCDCVGGVIEVTTRRVR
jgi:hypothetical protein